MSELINAVSSTTTTTLSTSEAFLYTAVAGLLGILIAITYMKTGKVSMNFARTLIVMPMLVCVVMLVVNGNLGTSIAVVGAFSLTRFRSLQGTSREIAFIFFAMAVGITCSIGSLGFAVLITAFICIVHFVLQFIHFGEKRTDEKELRITIPENLDYNEIFDDIFANYTKSSKLVTTKTTNMGSMYDLTYHITMKDEKLEKKMIDEIRCRNGNLTVVCGRRDYSALEEL